ncbi:LysR family transcriptional regulator [Salinisphaera orenii YIM 95161]|uniref:LysR family transcriptional regulator n=2 Tax=Salinisphaera TaxID=180541 RepID=A0A423Q0U1_9GAMM|nr:LysR family transcriptional regulator [Salinisphaera halophila YIM 95161]
MIRHRRIGASDMTTLHFTLRQLEIFAAVVRTGQVKRAAAALHLSQAAVSQALRELAEALDLTLFERDGRRIVPTAAARQLLRLAAAPMAEFDALPGRLRPSADNAELAGDIRIAASSTIARYILPSALAAVRREHPALDLAVISGNSSQAEAHVAALEADIGFIEGPPTRDDLHAAAWRTDTLQIIAPPDYPVAAVSPTDLAAHPWVAREPGSGTRAVFEQSLALAGLAAPQAHLVIDDSGAIVRAVAAGAGLACVSRLAAIQASANARVQCLDLPGLSLQRPLWCLSRAGHAHSPLIERFRATLDGAIGVDFDESDA